MGRFHLFSQEFGLYLTLCLFVGSSISRTAPAKLLDFSACTIVVPKNLGKVEQKAVLVLQEEIQKRTGILPPVANKWPKASKPVIAIGYESALDEFAGPLAAEMKNKNVPGPEGFILNVKNFQRPSAIIVAMDSRGFLYGIGRLLRKAHLGPNSIRVPEDLNISTAPKYGLRGHQLGYRPKTNAYDAWSPQQFDQYIRELALFGSNSIEVIPPISDDEPTSRHMKVPPLDMMIQMSAIIDAYGLDVWIWYPNIGKDYKSPQGLNAELAQREQVFAKLKRIDAILIPGGDPGNLHPDVFFPWIDRVAKVLWKYHPNAKIWVSPQAMQPTREWLKSFYNHVNKKPEWLGGVVFAPWVKTPLPELRKIIDKRIVIRHYPDITHNVECQYPVKNWDMALALTLHRECFNPRPLAMKTIQNLLAEYTCGSITYSEGINDDVNKFVWGDQDWDPEISVIETLRDYSRFFISPAFSDDIAQGFLAQERNWEGPLAVNGQVDITLQQWQKMEQVLPQSAKGTFRFQMGLLRAYYDAYIKRRLIYETELELQVMDILHTAQHTGSSDSMDKAEKLLGKVKEEPIAVDLKKKCESLADSLYEKIGSQLTVKEHGAQSRTRGAFMDGIDEPLNNAAWLLARFSKIRGLQNESEKLMALDSVLNRCNPGPGGFYDNMGAPGSEKRILNTVPWEKDPGTLCSPRISYSYKIDLPEDYDIPLAWKNQACVLYETPLKFLYENLDPEASYSIRVAYTGRKGAKISLIADDQFQVHDMIETWKPPVREFPIAKEATKDGRLILTWTCGEGERVAQVSEIWLIKEISK